MLFFLFIIFSVFLFAATPTLNSASPSTISGMSEMNFLYKTNDTLFFTNALCSELNDKYGHLYTDICEIEFSICDSLLEYIQNRLSKLQHLSKLCARIDCFMAMSLFCITQHLQKPEIVVNEKLIEIQNGRHILTDMKRRFIANSTSISSAKKNLINIIIAPNGSGKSVYLKEVAQTVYLAHLGCFVPAESARISLLDAIYTRIFTPESLHHSKSSFLIEVQQMGNVMTNSSSSSLILVDELGQGTNEINGFALVRSCLEHLVERGEASPITILSTHFTGIYDVLFNCEWVCFKTFSLVRNHDDGSISSTFELIDGHCLDTLSRDCVDVKQFMKRIMKTTDNDGQGYVY